jgi:hypothetical protein
LIYGRNLNGEDANWITLATTVRFHVGGEPAQVQPSRWSR